MSNPAIAQSPYRAVRDRAVSPAVREAAGTATPALDRSLAALSPGQEAVIENVDLTSPVGRRLLDLGFVAGSVVRVVRRAPLRDPIEYEIRGTRICLRRSESELIRVRPVPPS